MACAAASRYPPKRACQFPRDTGAHRTVVTAHDFASPQCAHPNPVGMDVPVEALLTRSGRVARNAPNLGKLQIPVGKILLEPPIRRRPCSSPTAPCWACGPHTERRCIRAVCVQHTTALVPRQVGDPRRTCIGFQTRMAIPPERPPPQPVDAGPHTSCRPCLVARACMPGKCGPRKAMPLEEDDRCIPPQRPA